MISIEKIEELNSFFTSNINLIPVANYGFSREVLEGSKKTKHTSTNKQLTLGLILKILKYNLYFFYLI